MNCKQLQLLLSLVIILTLAQPAGAGQYTPATVYPYGTQMWGYNWQAFLGYSHPGCILSLSNLWAFVEPGDWATLSSIFDQFRSACPNVGTLDSALRRSVNKPQNLIDHGVEFSFAAYAPEALGGVPPDEVDPATMPDHLAQFVEFTQANGKLAVYGPATELLCSEYIGWHSYTLDTAFIAQLASLLPDNSIWFVRPIVIKQIYPDQYREKVQELVDAIHQGNPTLQIWAYVLLFNEDSYVSAQEYLTDREALAGVVDATYMAIAGPNLVARHASTLEAMGIVWQEIGSQDD